MASQQLDTLLDAWLLADQAAVRAMYNFETLPQDAKQGKEGDAAWATYKAARKEADLARSAYELARDA